MLRVEKFSFFLPSFDSPSYLLRLATDELNGGGGCGGCGGSQPPI